MENTIKVRCNMCEWIGDEEDLVLICETHKETEYLEYYNGCPNCLTDGYLMDLED